jgi:energy-coupling factor transporter ATP-binding protein EcfA2
MSEAILIIGPSGSGKSASMRTLNPKETVLISALGKSLPFKNSKKDYSIWNKESNPNGNVIHTSNSLNLLKWMDHVSKNMPHVKSLVIDDNTHFSSLEYIRRIKETSWEKFNDIAANMVAIVEKAKSLREDLVVFFLHHTREVGDGILEEKQTKAMTIGKLVDEKMSSYEAFFTVVLSSKKKKGDSKIEYVFLTQDADSTTKSPIGMFETEEIPNDLALVRERVVCYFDESQCK